MNLALIETQWLKRANIPEVNSPFEPVAKVELSLYTEQSDSRILK